MGCETCKERDKHVDPVPYIVHESEMSRAERDKKRWFIISLVIFLAFVVSNAAWLYRESQFATETETKTITNEVEQNTDGGGTNTFYGGDFYGSAEGEADSDYYGSDTNP